MRRTKSTNVLEAMKPLTEDKEQVVTHLPIKRTKSTNDLEMIKPGTEDKVQLTHEKDKVKKGLEVPHEDQVQVVKTYP